MRAIKSFTFIAFSLLLVGMSAVPAQAANTPPNPSTPQGFSWINVSESSKIYLEPFDETSGYDDDEIFLVPAGVSCTVGSVTATGPFLTARNLGSAECGGIDPIDNATRSGSIPFGFTIDFFGTDYSSAWPNTNGGIFFDQPDSAYDEPLAQLAYGAESSVMFAFGGDLYYYVEESNFWTAQTTIDGKNAIVFSWENFHNCCTSSPSSEDISFQLVLIDLGLGDFNAYFNFDSIQDFNQGYNGPAITIDLYSGVSVGSNIATAMGGVVGLDPGVCYEGNVDEGDAMGTATDSVFVGKIDDDVHFKLVSSASGTVSLWDDSACSSPISPTLIQDIPTDGHAYIEFQDDNNSYSAVAVGWGTYNSTNGKIDWTELLRNVDADELDNAAVSPLKSRSLNTTVPGRFVIGQRGGQTVVDSSSVAPPQTPVTPTPPPAPATATQPQPAVVAPPAQITTLAATGYSQDYLFALTFTMFLLGLLLVGVRGISRPESDR